MENMKSADSSQFPWQRWAVPAHCGLLLSAVLRPLPALLPHFPLSLLALLVFVYFFPLMLLWTVGLWSHWRPRICLLLLLHLLSLLHSCSSPLLLLCSLLPPLISLISSFTLLSSLFFSPAA